MHLFEPQNFAEALFQILIISLAFKGYAKFWGQIWCIRGNVEVAYTRKKISICLNRGRANSLCIDDVLALNNAKRPQFK